MMNQLSPMLFIHHPSSIIRIFKKKKAEENSIVSLISPAAE
jgi:hypothetical protein